MDGFYLKPAQRQARSSAFISFFLGYLFYFSLAFAQPVCNAGLCWDQDVSVPYPIAFVGAENTYLFEQGSPNNLTYVPRYTTMFGTDTFDIGRVQTFAKLYLKIPGVALPVLLFPRAIHEQQGLIDASHSIGSVQEPNVTLDGNSVLFTYFHDAEQKYLNGYGGRLGADIYKIDIEGLIANPSMNPDNLPVHRLTSAPSDFQEAINPGLTSIGNRPRTRFMHAIEIQTPFGLRVAYISDKRGAQGAVGGTNFNLHIAKYGPNGGFIEDNQFKYYTTSAAMSPANARNGLFFSYQSSTADASQWVVQHLTSSGEWYPAAGYGGGSRFSWHLHTLCPTSLDEADDYLIVNEYYTNNNAGFGMLFAMPTALFGKNDNFVLRDGNTFTPAQAGQFQYSTGFDPFQDHPSSVGKMTSPRCGRINELLAAYSPTESNHRNVGPYFPPNDPKYYDSHLVFRDTITTPAAANNSVEFERLLDETTGTLSLLWPTPVLSHEQRFNEPPQTSNHISNISGMPEAEIGTSALSNTDIPPGECRNLDRFWNPAIINNASDRGRMIKYNVDTLTYVRDEANIEDVCQTPVLDTDVFGVALYLQESKIDSSALNPVFGREETVKRLGIVSVLGQADTSFRALIPSKSAFELQLLHKRYALKLNDVRSWHDLEDGESRTNCGGCHNHDRNDQPVPWEGSVAAHPNYQTADLTATTPVIEYDATCTPQLILKNTPVEPIPLWGDNTDLYQKFISNQKCGSCHGAGGTPNALAAFSIGNNARETYENLRDAAAIDSLNGALQSPAFWAARGERTDGRSNKSAYEPFFNYSNVHDNLNLCAQSDNWVYEFGLWLDNHMPVQWEFVSQPYELDRAHPTVASALSNHPTCDLSGGLKVGFWDDSGEIERVELTFLNCTNNCTSSRSNGNAGLPNGFEVFDVSQLINSDDAVRIKAVDFTGNQQSYIKTKDQLIFECNTGNDPRSGIVGPGGEGGENPPSGDDDDDDDDSPSANGGGENNGSTPSGSDPETELDALQNKLALAEKDLTLAQKRFKRAKRKFANAKKRNNDDGKLAKLRKKKKVKKRVFKLAKLLVNELQTQIEQILTTLGRLKIM